MERKLDFAKLAERLVYDFYLPRQAILTSRFEDCEKEFYAESLEISLDEYNQLVEYIKTHPMGRHKKGKSKININYDAYFAGKSI